MCFPFQDSPHHSLLLIVLTQVTHLHTYLAPTGLWSLKSCSTLSGWDRISCLAGDFREQKELHLWSLSSKPFLSNSLYSYSSPIPFSYHPKKSGKRIIGECKMTKINEHYQTLPSTSVSSVTRTLRGPVLGWQLCSTGECLLPAPYKQNAQAGIPDI